MQSRKGLDVKSSWWRGVFLCLLVGLVGPGCKGGLHLPQPAGAAAAQKRVAEGNSNPMGKGADGLSPYDRTIARAREQSELPEEFMQGGRFYQSRPGRKRRKGVLSVLGTPVGSVSHYFDEEGNELDSDDSGRWLSEVRPGAVASPLLDAGFVFPTDDELRAVIGWVLEQWRENRGVWYRRGGGLWTGYRDERTLRYMWRAGWNELQLPEGITL
jgi:hypothetical protein